MKNNRPRIKTNNLPFRLIKYTLTLPILLILFGSCADENEGSLLIGRTSTTSTLPAVSSVTPADGSTDVSISTNLNVEFNTAMDAATITTNSSDTTCSGSIQLSDDGFLSCVQMKNAPTAGNADKTFSVTPTSDLKFKTVYKVRLTEDAADVVGNTLAGPYTSTNGFETVEEPIYLPDTGQSLCFDNTAQITCPSSGASFYGQDAQYSTRTRSLVNNTGGLTGTVSDNNTKLMWQKDHSTSVNNTTASSGCAGVNLGGFDDWRLPNIKELHTLVDYNETSPTIDTNFFPNTFGTPYWSLVVDASNASSFWAATFAEGWLNSESESNTNAARCVRGDQTKIWPLDFEEPQTGVILHNATGLMWQKGDNGTAGTWQNALSYCEGLELGGFDDWRLPNVSELASIVDYGSIDPAIDLSFFPTTKRTNFDEYWTSTTYMDSSAPPYDQAFLVRFDTGFTHTRSKTSTAPYDVYTRCVRGGL